MVSDYLTPMKPREVVTKLGLSLGSAWWPPIQLLSRSSRERTGTPDLSIRTAGLHIENFKLKAKGGQCTSRETKHHQQLINVARLQERRLKIILKAHEKSTRAEEAIRNLLIRIGNNQY